MRVRTEVLPLDGRRAWWGCCRRLSRTADMLAADSGTARRVVVRNCWTGHGGRKGWRSQEWPRARACGPDPATVAARRRWGGRKAVLASRGCGGSPGRMARAEAVAVGGDRRTRRVVTTKVCWCCQRWSVRPRAAWRACASPKASRSIGRRSSSSCALCEAGLPTVRCRRWWRSRVVPQVGVEGAVASGQLLDEEPLAASCFALDPSW